MAFKSKNTINAWWNKDTLSFTLYEGLQNPSAQVMQKEDVSPAAVQEAPQEPSSQEMPLADLSLLFANSDFELGDLTHWTQAGNAFDFQPTKGDNPTARGRKTQPSQHRGEFWIGTFEKYQGTAKERPGMRQGDRPTGTLTSVLFEITADKISFLIGGGRNADKETVSLMVDGQVVHSATGTGNETLKQQVWDVSAYMGRTAQIVITDAHPGGWGHINADDFRYVGIQ
ncbi:MAG: hypothetical protein K8S13_02215 [Desulfobacula sp.]|uniref:hypothetical protein n=1 Tax=Desulfobacula sp. TaxID=2593537 RepID=UPI0025C15603|nr:hypothetical protein [Desulfobacula sp.]MCD4718661.1 hypothetical protein [Desulfobacula sp.]